MAAFGAWQGLMRAAASSGLLAAKARLLAQPLQHALAANSRPETLQVLYSLLVATSCIDSSSGMLMCLQHALAANSRPGTLQVRPAVRAD